MGFEPVRKVSAAQPRLRLHHEVVACTTKWCEPAVRQVLKKGLPCWEA